MTRDNEWELGDITKWFEDRGFGFVRTLDGDQDAFLHTTIIPKDQKNDFHIGRRVEIKAIQDKKGLRAIAIRLPQD